MQFIVVVLQPGAAIEPSVVVVGTWLVGTIAFLALLLSAGRRFYTGVFHDGWTQSLGKALWRVVVAGLIAYALPTFFEIDWSPNWIAAIGQVLTGITQTIYAVMQTVTIQAPLADSIDIVKDCLGYSNHWLVVLYALCLSSLAIVTPVVVVTSAVDSLSKHFRRMRFMVSRHRQKVVYVFADLSHESELLARDIFAHRSEAAQPRVGHQFPTVGDGSLDKRLRPLVVFCGVTRKVRDDRSDLIRKLRDEGKGDVTFTRATMSELVKELKGYSSAHCFVFTEDHSENRELAAELIDTISEMAAHEAIDLDGAQGSRTDDACVNRACEIAMKFSVYCTNRSREDELFFDSLNTKEIEPDKPSSGILLSTQELEEFKRLAKEARKQIEVRLVSHEQERVFDALTNHPLYKVLDDIDPHADPDGKQELLVIVAGLGTNGIKALETAYWMGRLYSVRLHILGIDMHGKEIERRLCTTHPDMMEEKDKQGEPVVCIKEAEAFTKEFQDLLRPKYENTRIYAMVTMGDDQLNLDVALSMRRIFDDLMLEGKLSCLDAQHRPMVLPLICAHETFAAARSMTSDRNESFEITPFGRNRTVFSFENIVVARWEQYAVAMAAAYLEMDGKGEKLGECLRGTEAHASYREAVEDFGRFEIRKLSNRTCVRHIPYRLWSLGIDPDKHFDERGRFEADNLTNLRWFEALGITVAQADAVLRQMNDHDIEMTKEHIEKLRNEFPAVCKLADLEHERWVAFYRSQGWRDLTIDQCQKLVDMGIIGKLKTHQSPKLRRHCYLCDIDKLVERGVALNDDPFVYDRAALVETQRILEGTVFEPDEG